MLHAQQCFVGLMQFVQSLTDRTPLFPADVAAGAVAGAFALRPDSCTFPVTDSDGTVLGLIERDALTRAIDNGQSDRPIGELMTPSPLALDAACTVREALGLAVTHPGRPEALVVMDGRQCLGVCSVRDLAEALLAEPAPGTASAGTGHTAVQEMQRLYQAIESEVRAHALGLIAMTDRLERQPMGPDAQAQVHTIRDAGGALLRLAGDAKDMLQANRGELKLDLGPQSLRHLMDRVEDRWRQRARDAGVGLLISYDGDPDLLAVIDAERLTQVFDNLLDNALRYTRNGSVEAALKARAKAGQVTLEGRVRDTSAAASVDALDEPGLPLSLARGVLASMNGRIQAESNAGQGMTLTFDLIADAAQAQSETVEERLASGAAHVLVVDDNATNRMVAEALCEMFDCTSETAEDGVEAVEAARTGRFDLILMDIKMPRMDGIAATRAIRSLEGPEAMTPIVALTANVDPEDARSYLAAGMCGVVEKPIKPDRLLQAINTALTPPQQGADGGRIAAA
jgi:CheY-like chemotaxis protein/signal transduction histidine kinase